MPKYKVVDPKLIAGMLLSEEQKRVERVKKATIPASEKGVELIRSFISPDAVKLRASIQVVHTEPGTSIVGTSASHARAYEKGTRDRRPHPFMAPAQEQAKKDLEEEVVKAQNADD